MGLEFLHRVLRSTAFVGVLVFAFVAVYYQPRFGLGILFGCAWGIGNFWALTRVIPAVLTPNTVDRRRALLLAAIKFPALYGIGYLVLRSEWFTPIALLIGFSLLFVVVVLKAAGRMFLRLDDRSAESHSGSREPIQSRI